jgi:hypothetical protein
MTGLIAESAANNRITRLSFRAIIGKIHIRTLKPLKPVATCPRVSDMTATEPLGPMIRIRDLRLARNWTASQLVDRIREHGVEVTEASIYNVENGNKQASARLLTAWAQALGIDPMNAWHGPLRKPVAPGRPGRAA